MLIQEITITYSVKTEFTDYWRTTIVMKNKDHKDEVPTWYEVIDGSLHEIVGEDALNLEKEFQFTLC